MQSSSARRFFPWIVFLASAFAGIAFVFIPMFIISPFRHQTPGSLALAMAVRQQAPWATLAAAFLCLGFAFVLWRASDHTRKAILTSVMLIVTFAAVLSRLNHFEWMFHPLDTPRFESASASKLDKTEMVLAIPNSADARAYPIREMAYHHILNDVVAGVPVAVTY